MIESYNPAQPTHGQANDTKKEPVKQKRPMRDAPWYHTWLFYSLFMFIPLFYQHHRDLIIGLAIAFPLFLFFYFGAWYGRTQQLRRLSVLGMFLLAIIYVPINTSAIGIYIFVASIIPFLEESPKVVFWTLGIEALAITAEAWFFHMSPWTWTIGLSFPMLVGTNNLRLAEQRRADAKLRLAHEEVENLAKLAERERIARDLHDILGHTLSLIVLKSELAQRLNPQDPNRASQEMHDVEQTARQALADVRQAIKGYRAEGIKAELERIRNMLDAAGIALHCETQPPRLAATEEAVLSLIVREAVTNIVRHSQAKECRVNFHSAQGATTLTIQDDGCGGINTEGNGIRGMRERIEALGGSFDVLSAKGTQLNIKLPRSSGMNRLLQ